jgi:hypothetical protein
MLLKSQLMPKFFPITGLSCIIFIFSSCTSSESAQESDKINDSVTIEFIDQYILPFEYQFRNTTVGGLSSIEYGGSNNWYFISDDRSEYEPARFYQASLEYSLTGIDTLIFERVVFLKEKDSTLFELNALDPEAIRFNKRNKTLFYSSEGGRTKDNTAPFIREMDTLGHFVKSYDVPSQFNFYDDRGVRDNGVFESLAFENDSTLWYANELPLIEDGEVPQFAKTVSPIRLSQLDIKNNEPLAQYAYMIEPVQKQPIPAGGFNINSVVELLVLDAHTLLVMERSYIEGIGNYVKIFKVDISEGTEISGINSLVKTHFKAVKKELLIDFSDYGLKIDNIEGMTFGKDFEDGRKSLVCISDDNFSKTQQTQVWVFAIKGL